MDAKGMIDKYNHELEKLRAYQEVSDIEVDEHRERTRRVAKGFFQLTHGRPSTVSGNRFWKVYEAIDMKVREVDGVERQIAAEPAVDVDGSILALRLCSPNV